MSNLCTACNKRPIENLKRRLCMKCYQQLRKKGKIIPGVRARHILQKEESIREMQFIKSYFTHQDWIYEPATFRVNDLKYTPDFYDMVRNMFIEVAGTRQAFHANKHKYGIIKECFPLIGFEIRLPNGNLLSTDENGRYIWEE